MLAAELAAIACMSVKELLAMTLRWDVGQATRDAINAELRTRPSYQRTLARNASR
jgi:hypothetical protein